MRHHCINQEEEGKLISRTYITASTRPDKKHMHLSW